MVKIESKEKLAKLLAMEDLDIQHKQVRTAMFDIKNRCLILPIWKDVSNDLYDLLVGHEVGHALFTPNNEKKLKSLIKKTSKHCINVVEDARIESLMKKRYPGLVKSFYKGYGELVEKDFFGLNDMDWENINLLDKLNLHFKVPSAINGLVEFNEIEQSFIDRIEKIKKFDELEKICIDICEYIKENRTEEEEQDSKYFDNDSENYSEDFDNMEEYESESGEDAETEEEMEQGSAGDDEDQESEESKADEDKEEKSETDNGGEKDDNLDVDSEEKDAIGTATNNADHYEDVPDDMISKTLENFEKELEKMTDRKTDNEYLTVPKIVLDNNINDYKEAWKPFKKFFDLANYRSHYAQGQDHMRQTYDWSFENESVFIVQKDRIFQNAKITLDEIKKESSKNVAHMAMEFERKKCADVYKRTLIAKTGVLDTNKLFSAKYNEDVFKKSVRVPDGKNHGLVMFVDWSGSMAPNMKGCIKQLIELMLFCKKVNIPFEVYSFTDVTANSGEKRKTFKYGHGDLVCDSRVTLNNYFSNRMSTKDFNDALLNMTVISNSFHNGYQQYPIPAEDRLGYTPLNGSIIASEKIIRDFKKLNAIDKVHAVWITDGEGNNQYEKYTIQENGLPKYTHVDRYNKKLFIQDEKMKKNYEVCNSGQLTPTLFKIVKDRLGINVVGFFLDSGFGKKSSMMKYWYKIQQQSYKDRKNNSHKMPSFYNNSSTDCNAWVQKCKKDGFLVKVAEGYDEYYVISDAPKVIKTNEIEEKMTSRRMATIFSANATKFKKSRVILTKFIDLITV